MTEGTDEAKKVKRNEGSIWHAVFKKKLDKEVTDEEIVSKYFL